MSQRFEDERGWIDDLLANIDGVTEIFTKKGAVRGNHTHRQTMQYTYVVSGRLLFACWDHDDQVRIETEHGPGEMVVEMTLVPHAWKALEDTKVLVFKRGTGAGGDYERDVIRMEVPLLS